MTQYTYDANSNRTTLIDPLNQTTTFAYDALNRLTAIDYSDANTADVSYQYDANGNRTQMVDGTGTTTYSYDELDRLLSVTSPGPKTVGYRYDRDGNRTKVIYPDSTAVTYTFDKASRLESLLDWANHTTSYQYFADGSLKQIANPNGTVADYSYDHARRLTQVWNQQGINTLTKHTYTLDAIGNRTQVQEVTPLLGTGTPRAWGDNLYGQLGDNSTTRRTSPVQVANLTSVRTVAAGKTHSLAVKSDGTLWTWGNNTYGQLGATSSHTCSFFIPCSRTPIQVSALSGVAGAAGGEFHSLALKTDGTVWAWGVNASGQVGDGTTTNRPAPVQVTTLSTVRAVAAGDEHSLAVLEDGTVWAWGSDEDEQLGANSTAQCGSIPCNLTPVPVSDLSGVATIGVGGFHSLAVKSDGTVWGWGGNLFGQLGDGTTTNRPSPVRTGTITGITNVAGGGFHGLAVEASGQLQSTLTYEYDQLYRLTAVTAPSGPTSYSYDLVGNRLSKTAGSSTSYSYDRADRITAAGATSYTVDANGNLVARGSDSFAYDQANRLKSATIGSATSTYTYDGDGKRTSKTVGANTTSYVYDVNRSLPVVLDDGSRKYVWGLGLSYAVDKSTGTVEVYHTDGLGSVRAITDDSGAVTQTYQTDEFGVPTQTQGSSTNPFQYTGEQRDGESGFVYLRARVYDPVIGRFLQRDPFAGTIGSPILLNRYAYALPNPVLFVDPSGHVAQESKGNSAPDNLCFSTAGGMFDAYLVNVLCTNTQMAGEVQIPIKTPLGPALLTGILPMSPSGDPGDHWAGGLREATRHFRDHGWQFRATSVAEYTTAGLAFMSRAISQKLPGKIDVDGTIRMYERATNTFVAFVERNGPKLITFMKPDRGIRYFNDQPGRSFYGKP